MEELRTRLEIFSEENNMSYTKIAKAMGVGASTLSEWRKGTYTGDNEAFSEKVEDFLNRHKRKIKRINFSINTESKKRVFHVLNRKCKNRIYLWESRTWKDTCSTRMVKNLQR